MDDRILHALHKIDNTLTRTHTTPSEVQLAALRAIRDILHLHATNKSGNTPTSTAQRPGVLESILTHPPRELVKRSYAQRPGVPESIPARPPGVPVTICPTHQMPDNDEDTGWTTVKWAAPPCHYKPYRSQNPCSHKGRH